VERVVEIMRRAPWADLKQASRGDTAAARRDVKQHGAVAAAIERGNPSQAARAMRAHLQSVERDLLEHVE
jgi:DNA-binding GntR family transcriptional regulator